MNNSDNKNIASFAVDHTRLQPGLYVSRTDIFYGNAVTTFDLRFIRPNCILNPPIAPAALHTIEHLGATYLRNRFEWKDKIVYFGPMGCRTGCYAIIYGQYQSRTWDIRNLFISMAKYILDWEGEIPGATIKECGNYLDHNLPAAKKVMKKWLEVLEAKQLGYDQFAYPEKFA